MSPLAEGVRVLRFEGPFRRTRVTVHPVLLQDPQGPMVADTGLPGQVDTLPQLLAEHGTQLAHLRWLVLTHEDLDYIGNAPEVATESGAQDPPRVRVSRYLQDGEGLPSVGEALVAYTPGHLSLYLEAHRVLVAGDALVVADGQLQGPRPEVTLNIGEALRSVAKLAVLEPDYVLCYHGGVFGPGAAARLREIAAQAR